MKKMSFVATAVVCFVAFSAAVSALGKQVYSEASVHFGESQTFFSTWSGDNSVVPPKKILKITSATFNYVPSEGGTVGRADVSGRDANGTAVWRTQIVYVEPKKTLHLTFPDGLLLEEGGHVEVNFFNDGPGAIFVSLNGHLE
jgi:hypothetical protein